MQEVYRNRRRAPRARPGLWIDLAAARPVVRIFASDLLEQRELEQLAELVRHVVEAALRRPAGCA